jgi:glycerol uptake facilitator-like aquaporin
MLSDKDLAYLYRFRLKRAKYIPYLIGAGVMLFLFSGLVHLHFARQWANLSNSNLRSFFSLWINGIDADKFYSGYQILGVQSVFEAFIDFGLTIFWVLALVAFVNNRNRNRRILEHFESINNCKTSQV